jgi:MFS family permease
MSPATTARRTFSSLSVRNYRLYFIGQLISLSGTWMQSVAQAWLVLKLTGSGTSLGLVTALQFLPVLFLGPVGGLVADRFDKRRVLYISNTAAGLLALALGLLVAGDLVRLWMVYVLAALLGFVNAFDNPTRQTFVLEMVGSDRLTNAITLNSVTINLARVIGPSIAGVLIVAVGLSTCFLLNAGSYLAVLVALALMRERELHRAPRVPSTTGYVRQLGEGLRYVRRTPALLVPLLMMSVVGMLAYEFQVSLPLLARFTFHGGAGAYPAMSSFMGAGAVVGGLITASRRRTSPTALATTAIGFGITILLVAVAPSLLVADLLLVAMGAVSIAFLSLGNTTLQLIAPPEMRGRVMALWSVAFLGSTPIGGPIVGWIGEHVGPRYGLGLGGVATLLAGAFAWRTLARVASGDADGAATVPPVVRVQAPQSPTPVG